LKACDHHGRGVSAEISRSVGKLRRVELRFLAGLSVEEAAVVLEVSPQTAARDWTFAKA
jgi:hypothetical protein